MEMIDVIVIGSDHHNTLGVIRALGEKGIRPSLLLVTTKRNPFVPHSRYIKSTVIISKESYISETLLKYYKPNESKPVVICCSDAAFGAIDENRNRLSSYFLLPGTSEQGRITNMMNKRVMAEMAVDVGLNIPNTCYGMDLAENSAVQLPCIIKPLVSKEASKSDIHICNKWSDVEYYVSTVGAEKVQIQQFIDKDYEYQLIGCSTGKDIIIPGVSIILRPCKGSNTSFLQYIPLKCDFCDIDKCKELIKRTGYRGLFSVEFLRDKSGKDFFMEINFRNDGNAICVTEAGVNLPYIWVLSCLGWDYQEEMNKQVKSCYIMPDWAEFTLLRTRQISLKEFLSDYWKTDRFMEYDRKDSKPFWQMILNKIFSQG